MTKEKNSTNKKCSECEESITERKTKKAKTHNQSCAGKLAWKKRHNEF